jgi:transcriptional regulator with XRE-family HTH domain
MGKEVRGLSEDSPLSEGGPDGGSIGSYLARQRRLRSITLAELSERTKLPLRSLERLESGAFDGVSDGFSRGFVRSVAGALGLDVDDAVMRLLQEPPDEELGRASARATLQRWAAGLALAVAAGLLLAGAWALGSALFSWLVEDDREVALEYRRDAIRDLVEAPRSGLLLDSPQGESSGSRGGEEFPARRPLDSARGVHPD